MEEMVARARGREPGTELTAEQRAVLVSTYAERRRRGGMPRGWVKKLAAEWGVNVRYMTRAYTRFSGRGTVATAKRSGRPTKMTPTKKRKLAERARAAGFVFTYNDMAKDMVDDGASSKGVSAATIFRHMRAERWRRVSRGSKPLLSSGQRNVRMAFTQSHITDDDTRMVHVDEKWAFTAIFSGHAKVPPGVPRPVTRVLSKRNVVKVMFLAAVARPDATHDFDGKIGIWPIVELYEAKRNSKNHKKGDKYWKTTIVDGAKYEEMMRKNVFPAVRRLMRWCRAVTIQHDGAKPHQKAERTLRAVGAHPRSTSSIKIKVLRQPPQSPDTNVLDLAVFPSLSRRVDKLNRNRLSVDGLMKCVNKAWRDMPADVLRGAFASRKRVLAKIIEFRGGTVLLPPMHVKAIFWEIRKFSFTPAADGARP